MKIPVRLSSLALLLALGGCTVTAREGLVDTVAISTDPPGANCLVIRAGADVASVGATPQAVRVSKSKQPLRISCQKAGHQTVVELVASEITGQVAYTGLMFGPMAAALEDARGANNRYPGSVHFLLPPSAFPSAADRDAFFDRHLAAAEERYQAGLVKHHAQCPAIDPHSGKPPACQDTVRILKLVRDKEVGTLESQRTVAQVGV